MKSLAIAAVASIAMMGVAGIANAQQDLAQKSGCLNCHAVDSKKMGPSFKDTAAKYKGNAEAEAKLVGELTSGKGHPAVKVSADDAKALVKWVLSM
jgi:cytochrome c